MRNTIDVFGASIDGDPLKWQSEGNTLLCILVEIENTMPGIRKQDPERLRNHLHEQLVMMDRARGWDMPNIDQQTEERFYGSFVSLYMTTYGHQWALRVHKEVMQGYAQARTVEAVG